MVNASEPKILTNISPIFSYLTDVSKTIAIQIYILLQDIPDVCATLCYIESKLGHRKVIGSRPEAGTNLFEEVSLLGENKVATVWLFYLQAPPFNSNVLTLSE